MSYTENENLPNMNVGVLPGTNSENPPVPDLPSLQTNDKVLEFARVHSAQDKAKAARTKARLRLQKQAASAKSTDHEGPASLDKVDWVAEAEKAEADEDSGQFDIVKNWFEALKNPTYEDKITYEAAKNKEDIRQKILLGREQHERQRLEQAELDQDALNQTEDNDNQLFCSQDKSLTTSKRSLEDTAGGGGDDDDGSGPTNSTSSSSKRRRRQAMLTNKEVRKSMDVGLNVALSKHRMTSGGGLVGSVKYRKPRGSRKRPQSKATAIDFESLFTSDIFNDARANASKEPIPTIADGNKERALTQLIASIPVAGREEAKSDKRVVLDATKKFNGKVKSDSRGGWKLSGLKTSLYHHQLLGAAFMRDRENSSSKPHGGMLCDVMGLGKTIQTLANIIDSRSSDINEIVRTTLIVVPAHLIDHWRTQIDRHCETTHLGAVLYYHSKSRISSSDPVRDLQMFSVIISSYEEIRRSYPKFQAPDSTITEGQIQEWYEAEFKKKAGPLHQLKYRRIILDEGHMIRNPESQTSISVRALHGEFKWVLSGTPLLNNIAEFWAYFDFLGVPQIGSLTRFTNYFCSGTETSNNRLVNIVRSIMFRRTYGAKLFSFPIVTLPEIGENTVVVEFCAAEKTLYQMIIDKFVEHINSLAGQDRNDTQYRCILTMILKLRMFNSHILAAEDVVKKILSRASNMNELNKLLHSDGSETSPTYLIVRTLNHLTKNCEAPSRSCTGKLTLEFQNFISELAETDCADQQLVRMKCQVCGMLIPTDTYVTTCMHLFCEDCLISLGEANQEMPEDNTRICPACDTPIECAEPYITGEVGTQSLMPGDESANQKKGKGKSKGRKANGQKKKKTSKNVFNTGNDDDDEDDEQGESWLTVAGHVMPSAKVAAVHDTIEQWLQQASDTKVVIFTQFRAIANVFCRMCERHKWGFTQLLGNMSFSARHDSVSDFKDDENIQVLIASLKAGGTGIDLTMANKCILVEPWWNEAIQQQAFCRLFRIGQGRSVEIVKLVVKDTIDDYMLELQQRKTKEIEGAMGDEVLSERDTIPQLLSLFGEVQGNEKDGFTIIPNNP